MTFAQFARLKRLESGVSIAQCGAAIGIGADGYIKKEQGRRGWSLKDVINLAALYALRGSELLAEYENAAEVNALPVYTK